MCGSSSRARKNVLNLLNRLNLARSLIELGARPVIASLMADIDQSYTLGLYMDIRNKKPPRGMLPSSPDWYFKSRARIVSSSALMAIYRRISNNTGETGVNELVSSYRLLKCMVKDESEDIDIGRAWILTRLVKTGQIKERKCFRCQSSVVMMPNVVFNSVSCPVCKSLEIRH